jgi:acyl-coenzyme A synthetase/AMP-(fatty) acid ligase
MVDYLLRQMESVALHPAVAANGKTALHGQLLAHFHSWCSRLTQAGVRRGSVVSIEGEYSVGSIAALLALAAIEAIAVPLSPDTEANNQKFLLLAEVEWRIRIAGDVETIEPTAQTASHPLFEALRREGDPGLVLFTSGSTGSNKAAVHNLRLLLEKYQTQRRRLRTIVFLQLDHIGGINTLLYTLTNGGMVIVPAERSPSSVCEAVAAHRAELLPTSPTFLNLLLLSREYQRHDLSSLRLITYGTEPMPESTLNRLHSAFPGVVLQQTYGMTEIGILQSKSRGSDSLWVRVGGDGYETKVVDGRLWVRAKTAMLGYLNAPSPFDADGFLDTQDQVETDGEWLRILGRKGETINVGGNKVYPAQVESVLLEMDNVFEAVVLGQQHPLTGHVVSAVVRLTNGEPPRDFRIRMRQHCQGRLPAFAVPAKVIVSNDPLYNARFKTVRQPDIQNVKG